MPATVVEQPLSVTFVFSDASGCTLNLADLPCPRLVADLAVGVANLAHPHGDVDAKATVREYRRAMTQLSRFLDGVGFTGGAGELSKTRMVEFWLGCHRGEIERSTRKVLRSLDEQTGILRPEVREYLAGPPLRHIRWRDRTSLPPYSPDEWNRLRACCEEIIESAWTLQRAAITAGKPVRTRSSRAGNR
jgi:hypothetical protein